MNNLDNMPTRDLRILRERIILKIETKQAEARRNLKAEFTTLARERGFDLSDIVGGKAFKVKAAAKFRDSKSGVLWSGRGRMPKGFDRNRAVPV